MAATVGAIGSFNRSVGVRVDMDEAITILPVDDVPFQRYFPSRPTSSITVEWMEEELTAQTATIVTSGDTDTPWTVVFDTDVTNIFRAGDVLHRQGTATDLLYLVDSVTDGTTIEVSEFGATNGASAGHDPVAGEVFEIVGQNLTEGGDPLEARSQERTDELNYTQIGQEKVEATRTQRKRAMYAQEDPYDHEVAKKFRELAIRFERLLVNGYRVAPSNGKRQMGGVFFYLSTNARSGTAANVKSTLNGLVRDCWTQGGAPSTLFCSPAVKAAITANYDASLRRAERSDHVAGFVVDKVLTDFGDVDIVADRYFPTTKAVLVQREYIVKRVFDGYFHELLAKTGDADQGQIVGEYSLEVKNEKAHGVLTVTDAA